MGGAGALCLSCILHPISTFAIATQHPSLSLRFPSIAGHGDMGGCVPLDLLDHDGNGPVFSADVERELIVLSCRYSIAL
jgi:hypothetical protein